MNLQNISNLKNGLQKSGLPVSKDNYQLEMLAIVTESLLLANQSHIARPEKVAMAKVWSDFLIEIIPIDELDRVYKKAIEMHEGDRPLNAFSLKMAWKKLQEQATEKRYNDTQKREEFLKNFVPDFSKIPRIVGVEINGKTANKL